MAHAYAARSDAEELRAGGFSAPVTKPLFPSPVVDALNRAIGLEQQITIKRTRHIPNFSGCRVLIAEDIQINAELVLSILEKTGAQTVIAENGQIALDKFIADDGFDAILMDINMPVMDGYNAAREIRSLPSIKAKKIPIIATTANIFKEDIARCLAMGMNDHIPKPIDENFLLATLSKYLFAKNGGKPAPAAKSGGAAILNPVEFLPYIDVQSGLNRLCENKKLYGRLLTNFMETVKTDALKAAVAENNLIAARDAAHAIKGTAANLSLIGCYKTALDLENALHENKPELCKILTDELDIIFKRTVGLAARLIAALEK
jgi:CheY-like chemotaxis protein/HPt (histidine-containing phosphotransfer) domain-containing protein